MRRTHTSPAPAREVGAAGEGEAGLACLPRGIVRMMMSASEACEGAMLGKVLFGAAVAPSVGYVYPLANEHAHNVCQALEKRYIRMAAPAAALDWPAHAIEFAVVRRYLEPLSSGTLAAEQIKRDYPALPAEAGCAVSYWTSLIDPRVERTVREAMR